MLISAPITVEYKGQPAQLSAIRSNGYCWGRLVLQDGTELDVDSETDIYDLDYEETMSKLEDALSDPERNVCPAARPFRSEANE